MFIVHMKAMHVFCGQLYMSIWSFNICVRPIFERHKITKEQPSHWLTENVCMRSLNVNVHVSWMNWNYNLKSLFVQYFFQWDSQNIYAPVHHQLFFFPVSLSRLQYAIQSSLLFTHFHSMPFHSHSFKLFQHSSCPPRSISNVFFFIPCFIVSVFFIFAAVVFLPLFVSISTK